MGMTIDEIIKYLPVPICGSTVIDSEKQKEYGAHDMAVIIMRKYQKIEEIVKQQDYDRFNSHNYYGYFLRVQNIRKVLEDGNDD